jgi:hypothetical protein
MDHGAFACRLPVKIGLPSALPRYSVIAVHSFREAGAIGQFQHRNRSPRVLGHEGGLPVLAARHVNMRELDLVHHALFASAIRMRAGLGKPSFIRLSLWWAVVLGERGARHCRNLQKVVGEIRYLGFFQRSTRPAGKILGATFLLIIF